MFFNNIYKRAKKLYFEITSATNEKIKSAKKLLANGKEEGVMLVEGEKPVFDAIKNGLASVAVFCSKKTEKTDFIAKNHTVYFVPPFIMEKITDTKTPQSLCMLAKRPEYTESIKSGRWVLCENIQDPKNLGAMIRTADAVGLKGVLLLGNNADEFSPKATRGAMGSNLYLPVLKLSYDELKALKKDFALYATVLDEKAVSLSEISFEENAIIAIGNEGQGLSEKLVSLCDKTVYIPMKGRAQSLNASVAAAIIMWEISK